MIKDKLLNEIKQYCKLNDIEDVEELINKMLQRGFTIEKFGEIPAPAIKESKKKSEPKPVLEPKSNKYRINVKIEEEKVIEEIIKIKPNIIKDTGKDLYGE